MIKTYQVNYSINDGEFLRQMKVTGEYIDKIGNSTIIVDGVKIEIGDTIEGIKEEKSEKHEDEKIRTYRIYGKKTTKEYKIELDKLRRELNSFKSELDYELTVEYIEMTTTQTSEILAENQYITVLGDDALIERISYDVEDNVYNCFTDRLLSEAELGKKSYLKALLKIMEE